MIDVSVSVTQAYSDNVKIFEFSQKELDLTKKMIEHGCALVELEPSF